MDAPADSVTCRHTTMPEGYIAWYEAAEWLRKLGIRQKQCGGCGRFKMWLEGDRFVDSFYEEFKRRKTAG